jgi:putative transport protein
VIKLLSENPLLLLFVVAGVGYAVGQIPFRGVKLGIAAVLFSGLAFGAIDPQLKLPDNFYRFGLVLFMYTIGLSSGLGFFSSFRKHGWRDSLLVGFALATVAFVAAALAILLEIQPALLSGLFAGSLTNTPALASVLELLKQQGAREFAEPVVAYSLAYPMGVLGMILAVILFRKVWRVSFEAEEEQLQAEGVLPEPIVVKTIEITNPAVTHKTRSQLLAENHWRILFGRMSRDGQVSLVDENTRFWIGDLVTTVGTESSMAAALPVLGREADIKLDADREEFDIRRIFVSNPKLAGRRIGDIDLQTTYGAILTRIRRGDIDILANRQTRLELGDRARVVASVDKMQAVSKYLGDSYRALSEIDIVSFSVGIALGLLLGDLPIPIPGGASFRLSASGGVLVSGLILGALGRTGSVLWQIPYSANLTLRQFGLVLFLAGIGTFAGEKFAATFAQGGIKLVLAGTALTMTSAFLMMVIGYKLLKIPYSYLIGMLAGSQTQPAVLAFANEQTKNEVPNHGYTAVFPMAMILKILLAQILLLLL